MFVRSRRSCCPIGGQKTGEIYFGILGRDLVVKNLYKQESPGVLYNTYSSMSLVEKPQEYTIRKVEKSLYEEKFLKLGVVYGDYHSS